MGKKRIPNISAFTPRKPNLNPGSNLKARMPTTPVSNKKTISSSHYKTIFLHDWWLVKPQGKGLAVGGVASTERGERVIFSTPIAKRHETNVLESQDGITFIVTGFINKSRTHENGFPLEFEASINSGKSVFALSEGDFYGHFLFGFPHNWEEYIPYGFGKECDSGNTGLDDSSTCPLKNAGDALPFIIDDNTCVTKIPDLFTDEGDLNCNWLLKKLLNDAAVQSNPADNNMECRSTMNTKECEGTEDINLGTSPQKDDQIQNIENGVSDVMLEAQHENPSFVSESVMNINSPLPCGGLSAKSMHKSPDSSKKVEKYPLSSVPKRKKKSEDANYFCRRVTRSISKMSQSQTTMPLSPIRRSPRLCNFRSQAQEIEEIGRSTMNTKECEGTDHTNLGTSPQKDDEIHNIENGVSDFILETQHENPSFVSESVMNINSPMPRGSPFEKSMHKSPDSSKKVEKYPLSSVPKRKKKSDDANYFCRRVTRSISKMSQSNNNASFFS